MPARARAPELTSSLRRSSRPWLIAASLVLLSPAAWAQSAAVAIVEEVTGEGLTIAELDFLKEGDRFDLGSGAMAVISYFASCNRETIHGGKVTIGVDGSTVSGGRIEAEKVRCTPDSLKLSEAQQRESAVIAFRKPTQNAANLPELGTTVPVILIGDADSILLGEIGQPPRALVLKNHLVDLGRAGFVLTPGKEYQVTAGTRTARFRVAPSAGGAMDSMMARLIAL